MTKLLIFKNKENKMLKVWSILNLKSHKPHFSSFLNMRILVILHEIRKKWPATGQQNILAGKDLETIEKLKA